MGSRITTLSQMIFGESCDHLAFFFNFLAYKAALALAPYSLHKKIPQTEGLTMTKLFSLTSRRQVSCLNCILLRVW